MPVTPERACGQFWNRAPTRCGAVFCKAIWPVAWLTRMKWSLQASFALKPFPKTSAWNCRPSPLRSKQNGRRYAFSPMQMPSCRTIAPELRSGDVVAILSNGGFGGIYEKLPARLRELASRNR